MNAAGAEGRLSLEPSAAEALHRATQGNLRRIHLVLDRCLYGLASTRASVVTAALVQRAVADLPALGEEDAAGASLVTGSRRRKTWILAGVLAGTTTATVAVASLGLVSQPPHAPPVVAADAAVAAPMAPPGQARGAVAPAMTAAAVADMSPRRACESQLEAIATAGDVLHVQRLPDGVAYAFKPSPRICRFAVQQEAWVAWLGRNEARHIVAAQQATRKVQETLKSMGLLDAREPDGLFGSRTGRRSPAFSNSTAWFPRASRTN